MLFAGKEPSPNNRPNQFPVHVCTYKAVYVWHKRACSGAVPKVARQEVWGQIEEGRMGKVLYSSASLQNRVFMEWEGRFKKATQVGMLLLVIAMSRSIRQAPTTL